MLEANKALDELDALIDQHGNDSHRKKAAQLRGQIDELIEQKRSDPLRRELEQVMELYHEILFARPEFWVGYFHYLAKEQSKMEDQHSAERLINQGRECIAREHVQGLRNVVAQLLGLLPHDVAETLKRGYESGILI